MMHMNKKLIEVGVLFALGIISVQAEITPFNSDATNFCSSSQSEEIATAPTATASVVPIRNLITVNFSKAMDTVSLADVSNYTIKLEDGTLLGIEDLIVNGDNTSVQFYVPDLEAGMTFAVEMTVTDPSGNEVIDDDVVLTQMALCNGITLRYYDYGNDTDNPADLAAFKNLVDNGALPTSIAEVDVIESPFNRGDYYCTYIEGYLVPPQTGNYRFAIASDDESQFYLSTDTNPENLSMLAEVTDSVYPKEYEGAASIQSVDVALVAGNIYYFRIYHFEASIGDSISLAWSLPYQGPGKILNDTPSIDKFYVLDPAKPINPANTVLEFVETPATSMTVERNSRLEWSIPLNFKSEIEGEKPVYRWFVKNDIYGIATDWTPVEDVFTKGIVGEPDWIASINDDTLSIKNVQNMHAGTYKMEAYFGGKHIVTPEITLNVTQDVTAPTATAVGSYTMEQVKLTFSEPISNGLDNKNNYSIDGLEVLNALVNIYGTNRYEVMLQTTRHEEGKSYTVHVSGLSDDAGNVMNNYTTKFTGFVWASGYTYLECFNDTIVGTTDTYVDWLAVREATQWTPVDHAYRQIANKVNPRVDNYIEIVKEDFDQDNCIERVVGYLAPQVSGNYRFAGACDDHMGFYLSTDESYVNTANEPVTWEQGWNSSISTFGNGRIYDWKNADGNEVTHEMGQVYLEAGKRYFFTAVLAEIGGGDYLTIDWAREGENFQANGSAPLLTGEYLGVYVNPDTAIIDILQQPTDMTVTAGETVEVFVEAKTENEFNAPITYQWYVDGVAQEGATSTNIVFVARPEYDGMKAYCELYVPGKTVLTDEVTLTVEANEVPVLPICVYGFGSQVIVEFDGAVDPVSAVVTDNYTIEGATVTGAKIQSDTVVELTVEGAAGSTIAVTVAEVGNASGLPMPEPVTVVGDYCILNQTIMNPIGVQGHAEAIDSKIYLYNGGDDALPGTETSCLFLYEQVEGDFDAVLCIESIEHNHNWAKVGLQFRASLDGDSQHIAMMGTAVFVHPTIRVNPPGSDSLATFPQINEEGTEFNMVGKANGDYETFPCQWIRLKREGDKFSCYRSVDGNYWTLVNWGDFTTLGENSTNQMPVSGYLGIAYFSQDQNNLHEAVVSGYNSSYVEPALPVPDESEFSFANVGQEKNGVVGFYDYDAETSTFKIWGNGSDVWGTSDHFSYVYRSVSEGDFTFTARIIEFPSSASDWSKAGIMLREGISSGDFSADSRYIATQTQRSTDTDTSGSNTQYVGCWRDYVGFGVGNDSEVTLSLDALVFPHWQRLIREGNIVYGYISLDGETWTEYMKIDTGEWEEGELGSTLPLYVGLWSTSHSTSSRDCCAVFDNVSFVSGSEPPAPEGPVLAYTIEGDELVLRWAVSSGAVLEVSAEANGQWVLAGDPAEIEDGTYIYRLPLTEAAAFYRLIVE